MPFESWLVCYEYLYIMYSYAAMMSMACMQWVWIVCDEYDLYVMSMTCILWVWLVCHEYGLYVMSMTCIWWVWLLCHEYDLYAMSMACMRWVWLVCDEYDLYAMSMTYMQCQWVPFSHWLTEEQRSFGCNWVKLTTFYINWVFYKKIGYSCFSYLEID